MKKLIDKETLCVLNPNYFKAVMETGSKWVTLPYDTKDAKPAWHRPKIFIKERGYVMTGFKINWPESNKPSSGIDMFDMFDQAPIKVIFMTQELYSQVASMKSNACIMEFSEYGMVNTRGNYGKMAVFCIKASAFVQELTDQELRKLKSVDAVITGY